MPLARWDQHVADIAVPRPARAARDDRRLTPHPLEWLLIELPEGESGPTKYVLATLPPETDLRTLVDIAKLRWGIERDYEELKSEIGLAHYEGRGWRGFHHHATLCIAAYGFLIRERAAFPPSAAVFGQKAEVPDRPRPRGAPDPVRASRPILDRDDAKNDRRRPRQDPQTMPVLPDQN